MFDNAFKILNYLKLIPTSYPLEMYEPKKIIWLYGKSGYGKSHQARQELLKYQFENPQWRAYLVPIQQGNSLWMNGYTNHELALIEEMRPGTFKYSDLLMMFDAYPCTLPTKGGFVNWCPKVIYVTSCHHHEGCYPQLVTYRYEENLGGDDSLFQLIRRITEIRNITHSLEFEPESELAFE
jgi:hypothetical protein